MTGGSREDYRLDQIDRQIIYKLMVDARNASAPKIAGEVGVTGATIRNRIANLEEHGLIEGYHPTINFERADDSLMNLFLCHTTFGNVETAARQLGAVPGVINVRELMGGRINLHVLAVGSDTTDLRRIGREIENLNIEIEDEYLLQKDHHFPYSPYGPDNGRRLEPLADYISLTGGAEVIEVTVHEGAPIAEKTLQAAAEEGILDDDTLVVAVERDDDVLTPQGHTTIYPQDIVTVFSPNSSGDPALDGFREPSTTNMESG